MLPAGDQFGFRKQNQNALKQKQNKGDTNEARRAPARGKNK